MMKKKFITLFICSFIITSEIKDASIKTIHNFYNDNIEIINKNASKNTKQTDANQEPNGRQNGCRN